MACGDIRSNTWMTADPDHHRPRAAVVLTGSELVTGVIADANGSWLAHELTARGFEVAHLLVVGDRPDDLAEALRYCAAAGCVLVVTSGGLGPTADDLTGEVVAAFAGVELQFDEALRERIAAIVARFPRIDQDPDARDAGVRKQAWVPRGAVVLEPVGTAPGLVVATTDGPLVVVLPGPPRELTGMWPARWRARRCRRCWRRCRRRPGGSCATTGCPRRRWRRRCAAWSRSATSPLSR